MTAVTVTNGIQVTNEVTIYHAELGAEAWGWDSKDQAAFFSGFATEIRNADAAGIVQLHFIADALRKDSECLPAVRWLAELLAEYLDEEPDGAPLTREEVTAGWTPPGYEMQQAWEQNQELTR